MAGTTTNSALQKAARGEKLTDRQAQSALGDALKRLTNLGKKSERAKEAVVVTGTMVLHSAETQGTLFLCSMAEGYFGKEKLELGGVDVRAPAAIVSQGFGIYEAMTGGRGGGHALALGNGLMGSWLASVAVDAGRTLRARRNAPTQQGQGAQQPAEAPAAMTPTMQGADVPALPAPSLIPEPSLRGPLREVLLTPGTEGDDEELSGRGRRGPPRGRHGGRRGPSRRSHDGSRRRPGRFPHAQFDDEDDEFDD